MIQKALEYIHDSLDQYLINKFGLDESKMLLNSIIESDGTVPLKNKNKVILSLINIEKETLKPFYVRNHKLKDGSFSDINPAERFNLELLVTSNFDDYRETLKFLDAILLFFQAHPSLSANSFSRIPKGIKKLELELEQVTYNQMHSLWTAMGAKYQPSVIYKTRLVSIQADEIEGFDPAVEQISNEALIL